MTHHLGYTSTTILQVSLFPKYFHTNMIEFPMIVFDPGWRRTLDPIPKMLVESINSSSLGWFVKDQFMDKEFANNMLPKFLLLMSHKTGKYKLFEKDNDNPVDDEWANYSINHSCFYENTDLNWKLLVPQ